MLRVQRKFKTLKFIEDGTFCNKTLKIPLNQDIISRWKKYEMKPGLWLVSGADFPRTCRTLRNLKLRNLHDCHFAILDILTSEMVPILCILSKISSHRHFFWEGESMTTKGGLVRGSAA